MGPDQCVAAQVIRDTLQRYEKRAQAEAAERGTRLSYIVFDLSSCDSPPMAALAHAHLSLVLQMRSLLLV